MNHFFNKQVSSDIPPLHDTDNDEIIYSPDKKAELFNSFFVKQSCINGTDDDPPDIQDNGLVAPALVFTHDLVYNILKDLDQRKAVGPDLVHNKLLVKAKGIISGPLAQLFNRSLDEATFPKLWKTAHVTPIHKKGDKSLCTNYRPISLLSCVGKVMENASRNMSLVT